MQGNPMERTSYRRFAFTHGVSWQLRQKPDEASTWHYPCKFVANERKSQIEIYLADAILH